MEASYPADIFFIFKFYLSVIVFQISMIIGKNSIIKTLSLKGNNFNNETTNDFDNSDLFVDFILLISCAIESFYLSNIVFQIKDKLGKIVYYADLFADFVFLCFLPK